MKLTRNQIEDEFLDWKGKNYRHYGPMEMGAGTYEHQAFEEGMKRGFKLAMARQAQKRHKNEVAGKDKKPSG